jgi:hypothetical protein
MKTPTSLLSCLGLAGCGAHPGKLLEEMAEWKAKGLDEENAPMISRLETLVNDMEDGCLLCIERGIADKQWIVSIAPR